ncbi:hypothetical protein GCM10011579_093970 [Streptomyces albiflavescens]|uniref:Tail protein n=1 Tax=Streptomyces albiflavescens TaxID=1623582 RepID=A0A917YG71_9ACTN|nr:phage tail sheath subtilisin-like domain-containing protein [Streptomyces albiflavescens]GGN94460.1 hypothetical protein GCM10011579_093970 [Streptomyces albiflavescens]
MAVSPTYPGVYIDEFTPAPPIQGVGTSTAAFVGRAVRGVLTTPVQITRWEQFVAEFGSEPRPGTYLWYAVRGFFENGGQTCYVVRAGNAIQAQASCNNKDGDRVLRFKARVAGNPHPQITVEIDEAHLVAGAELYRPSAAYTVTAARVLTLGSAAEAQRFRAGDWISLGNAEDPRLQIAAPEGAVLRTTSDITTVLGSLGTLRLADTVAGTQIVRIASAAPLAAGALVPGTVLSFTQGAGGAAVTETAVVQSVDPEGQPDAGVARWTYRVILRQGLTETFELDPGDPPGPTAVESQEFTVTVHQVKDAKYADLATDPAHPRYFLPFINGAAEPEDVAAVEAVGVLPPDVGVPASTAGAQPLIGGTDETDGPLTPGEYTTALNTLRTIDDVNLIAVPDSTDTLVQGAVRAQCEQLKDRFGILDSQPGLLPEQNGPLAEQRRSQDSKDGYTALYYPWIQVPAASGAGSLLVPPSGHVCGAIAQVDGTSGVFKSPANVFLNGTSDIQPTGNMTNQEQGLLNELGINVIRVFQRGGRPRIWGARTTATNVNWRYISVRRLFLFLEESIQEGIEWAVFEPNNLALWQQLKRALRAFLFQQWQDGALFGETADRAFYVTIDETNNSSDDRRKGRVNVDVGMRPTRPAEFIVVRIGIWDGAAEITEG